MSTIIEQAIKGNRKAMEQLYEKNKQKVFYISELLCDNQNDAVAATNFAFKNVWSVMSSHGVKTEEDFSHLVIRKAVDYCKKRANKKDSRAFRTPQGKNFFIPIGTYNTKEMIRKTGNLAHTIVKLLPYFQRYIFVLHNVGGYLPEQIASTFKLDMKTIGIALEAEQINIERLLHRTSIEGIKSSVIFEELSATETTTEVPSDVDVYVFSVIDSIAKPIEKKHKRQCIVVLSVIVAAIIATVGISAIVSNQPTDNVSESEVAFTENIEGEEDFTEYEEALITEPVIALDETLSYYVDIDILDYGTVSVKLDQHSAPITVSNFVDLAESGFYDGLTFHRIMDGFMMQGGDPNGDGTGGSYSNIVGEFTDNGYENTLSHTRGAISMARSSDYDSGSSQFFIVHEDSTESLDGQYAVFGYVEEGMDIVDAICTAATPTDDNGTIVAEEQPIISSITIRTE